MGGLSLHHGGSLFSIGWYLYAFHSLVFEMIYVMGGSFGGSQLLYEFPIPDVLLLFCRIKRI